MLSKLGNIDAATSTDRLTSIMNGFKLEVKDTSTVIDKLVNKIARTYRNIWANMSLTNFMFCDNIIS